MWESINYNAIILVTKLSQFLQEIPHTRTQGNSAWNSLWNDFIIEGLFVVKASTCFPSAIPPLPHCTFDRLNLYWEHHKYSFLAHPPIHHKVVFDFWNSPVAQDPQVGLLQPLIPKCCRIAHSKLGVYRMDSCSWQILRIRSSDWLRMDCCCGQCNHKAW